MKAIKFPEANKNVAEDQDEYITLPAYVGVLNNETNTVGSVSVFELTEEEILKLARGGKLIHSMLTFGMPQQPFNMAVDEVEGTEKTPFELLTMAEAIALANYAMKNQGLKSEGVTDADVREFMSELRGVESYKGE